MTKTFHFLHNSFNRLYYTDDWWGKSAPNITLNRIYSIIDTGLYIKAELLSHLTGSINHTPTDYRGLFVHLLTPTGKQMK